MLERFVILMLSISLFFKIWSCFDENRRHENNNGDKDKIESKVDTIVAPSNTEFSEHELKKYITHLNLKHPDIVYAQAVLETGNFKSNLFINNNNLFGIKEPRIRNNTSLGSIGGYAYYSDWRQSVIDYALYQSSYTRKLNREAYFAYLDKNYAKDPEYSRKLKEIIKRQQND